MPPLLRKRALTRVAQGLGFSFNRNDDGLWKSPFTEFPLFTREAGSRRIRNVMQGARDGKEILLFDYEFTQGGRDLFDIVLIPNVVYTVAALRFREGTLPNFQIGPRTILESLLHRTDPIFETQPEFSERYAVRGATAQELRSLLRPELLDAFASNTRTWYLEGGGDWLITYTARVKPTREEILTFVYQGLKFVEELGKALQLREMSGSFAEGQTLRSAPRAEAAPVLGRPTPSLRISWWRNNGLWAAILGLVGLCALLLAFSACQPHTNAEAAVRAFQTALGALAAGVAALTLSIRGLRRGGVSRLTALGLILGLVVGLLVCVGSLIALLSFIAGFCSGNLL